MAGVCTGPGPCDVTPIGAGKNWVNKVGGLPLYIRAIAQALIRSGHSESDAIQLAVGTVQRWARGGGKVTPATRARAAAALAEWEKKRAEAHLSTTITEAIDLAAPTKGAMPPMKGSSAPRFPINSHNDVKKAVRMVGLAKGNKAIVRRHIMARAKTLGASHLIPDGWTENGQDSGSTSTPMPAKLKFGSPAWQAKYGKK